MKSIQTMKKMTSDEEMLQEQMKINQGSINIQDVA